MRRRKMFDARRIAVGPSPSFTWVKTRSNRTRGRGATLAVVIMKSLRPMQDVADNGPSLVVMLRSLPQNPVAIQLVDGAILPLQLNPVVDEGGPVCVVRRQPIGERLLDGIGIGYHDAECRVQ